MGGASSAHNGSSVADAGTLYVTIAFPSKEIVMPTNDQNATPEQERPNDVSPKTDDEKFADEESMAPPTFQPAGAKDESERPIVNPITGGAI